jgi:hypothetical protein
MKKTIVLGDGKKNFLDLQKTVMSNFLNNLKGFSSKLFSKDEGKGKSSKMTLDDILNAGENIVQIYYNGSRIKKSGEKWIYTEDSPKEGIRAHSAVKFESGGNVSVRVKDGAHQKMLCFTIDSKMRLFDGKK